MRGWPVKPRRFSSRSATCDHCASVRCSPGAFRVCVWKNGSGLFVLLSANCCNLSKASTGSRLKSSRPRVSSSWVISPFSPVIKYRASAPPSPCRLPFPIIAQRGLDGGNRCCKPLLDLFDLSPQRGQFFHHPPAATVRLCHQRHSVQRVGSLIEQTGAAPEIHQPVQIGRNISRRAAALQTRTVCCFLVKPAACKITGKADPGGVGFDL